MNIKKDINRYVIFSLLFLCFGCNANPADNADPPNPPNYANYAKPANVLLVAGDYELNTVVTKEAKLFFSGIYDDGHQVYLDIKEKEIRLMLLENRKETVL